MIKGKYKTIFACILCGFISVNTPIYVYAEKNNQNGAQQTSDRPVRGTVKDKDGEPLIGAIIKVKGTAKGAVSDIDGNFSIDAKSSDILDISYMGFTSQEITVGNKNSILITLSEDSKVLDEIIVIGYGTTTRKNAIGAVDQVKSKMIEERPVANVTQALQGASPSLTIQQRSMDPNDNSMNINIRGLSTMNSNSPLIVIDGLVTDNASLNKLNPGDIENISVLKDAGTAAIYGSRSSNGVILVTTKTGKKNQRSIVRLGMQMGVQDPDILYRPVAGYQNAILKNLSLTNVGQSAMYSPKEVLDLYNHRNEEYWNYDKIMQSALQQSYNMSISGGSEFTTYMFSAGYFDQESNFIGPKYGKQRYNLRSNITTEVGRLKLTSILAYTRDDGKKNVDGNAIINSSRIPSYYWTKMQADNGKYLVNSLLTDQNPLAGLKEGGYEKGNTDYINANVNLEVKIIDGLKLKGIIGADIYSYHRFIRRKEVKLYNNENNTTADMIMNADRNTEDYNENKRLMNYQLLADYQKTFNKSHNLSLLFGATNESYTFKTNEVKFINTDPILGIPTESPKSGSTSLEGRKKESITSVLGRASYNYEDKYYAEFSFREDGSSKFAKNNRWGFFPSMSLGWRISDESFMDFYKTKIGDIKLRGSYGVLGNQNIDSYQTLTTYSVTTNTYVFDNETVGGAGYKYGNENLKWEKSKTFNVGADFSFLNGALSGTFDYFHKTTSDILLAPQVPTVFGTSLSSENIGEMKNHGWEITLNYYLKTGDFSHSFSGNLGDTQNKVTKLVGGREISSANEYYILKEVGLPFRSYYGYKTDGFFQTIDEIQTSALPSGISASDLRPGDVKYVDRNGDGIIDEKDRYVLGNGFPRYTFGFSYNVEWKGFDFGFFLQGVGKRDMMVRGELVEPFHSNYSYTIYKHQLDYWTPTNTDAKYPRLAAIGSASNTNNYGQGSEINKFDGKYLRLKNIQLGYTVPKTLTNKLSLSKVRAYVNAQNLFTLSKNSWIDPESSEFDANMGGSANSARNYPTLRYFGFGLDIEF